METFTDTVSAVFLIVLCVVPALVAARYRGTFKKYSFRKKRLEDSTVFLGTFMLEDSQELKRDLDKLSRWLHIEPSSERAAAAQTQRQLQLENMHEKIEAKAAEIRVTSS